jgi:hypothetical protein
MKKAAVIALLLMIGLAAGQTIDFTAGGGTTLESDSGVAVTLATDTGLAYSNPFPDDASVSIQQTTVSGPDSSSASLSNPSGAAPILGSIDTSGGTVTASTSGIQTIGVTGGITGLVYRDTDLSSSAIEFEVTGSGTLDVHEFAAGEWVYVSRSNSQDILSQANGSGVASFQATDEDITLLDTGGVSLSNPQPNGEIISTSPAELQVDVADPDFSADEEVTLEWYIDGSLDGTTTATSDGTATYTSTVSAGGQHDWHVEATDRQGNTNETSASATTFSLPNELVIYNETNHTEVLNNANATIEFYYEDDQGADQIVQRDAPNGVVNMTGLPTDESFIVVAEADGYFSRRIYVGSLVETQSVYLLNETAESVQPVFTMQDFTGRFPTETTVIEVQKSINGSWETVVGDYFGASNEVGSQLAFNQRHRIIITNTETGFSRDLGAYTPTSSAVTNLEVHVDETIVADKAMPSFAASPSTRSFTEGLVNMSAQVRAGDMELESYTIELKSAGQTIHTYSGSSPERHNFQADLTGYGGNTTTLWFNYTTEEGWSDEKSVAFDVRESYDGFSFIGGMLAIGGDAPNTFTIMLTLLIVLFATGFAASKMETGAAALVSLAIIGGAAMVSFVPTSWFVASVITFLVMAGVRQRL